MLSNCDTRFFSFALSGFHVSVLEVITVMKLNWSKSTKVHLVSFFTENITVVLLRKVSKREGALKLRIYRRGFDV